MSKRTVDAVLDDNENHKPMVMVVLEEEVDVDNNYQTQCQNPSKDAICLNGRSTKQEEQEQHDDDDDKDDDSKPCATENLPQQQQEQQEQQEGESKVVGVGKSSYSNEKNGHCGVHRWWHDIPKGAEAIIKEIAAERVLVDLLDNRLEAPKLLLQPQQQPAKTTTTATTTTSITSTGVITTGSPLSSSSSSSSSSLSNSSSCVAPTTTTAAAAVSTTTTSCGGIGGVNFAAVQQLLHSYPGLCHKTFEFQWDHGDTRILSPLAILCCFSHVPIDLLEWIYQTYPIAMTKREQRKGCLPFHYACTFEATSIVLDYLYTQYPIAISTPRYDGMYPSFGYIFQGKCNINTTIGTILATSIVAM